MKEMCFFLGEKKQETERDKNSMHLFQKQTNEKKHKFKSTHQQTGQQKQSKQTKEKKITQLLTVAPQLVVTLGSRVTHVLQAPKT